MYDYQMNGRFNCDCNMQQNCNVKKDCIQPESAVPKCMMTTMAYIPFQENTDIYSIMNALDKGTLFPCLDKPFIGGCCR